MEKFVNKEGKIIQRQPVQCYTRVMGYLRPVKFFNVGKKSEFYSRIYFDKIKACNKNFVSKFMSDAIC
ncbi:MAG TPA: hypothetical protein VJ892_02235 [Candidatus Absconditabacterales bacterium]|nr:hypothetical protein [Candidatus Absconditabacterales bacterium]